MSTPGARFERAEGGITPSGTAGGESENGPSDRGGGLSSASGAALVGGGARSGPEETGPLMSSSSSSSSDAAGGVPRGVERGGAASSISIPLVSAEG